MSNLILGNVRTEVVHVFEKLTRVQLLNELHAGRSIQSIKKKNLYNEMLMVSFDTVPFKVKPITKVRKPITGNITLEFALTDDKTKGKVATHKFYFPSDLVGRKRIQITTVGLYDGEIYVEPECIPCSVPTDDDDVPGRGSDD